MVMKKESIGQRGKTAQDLVQKHLDLLNEAYAGFSYIRLMDARAAGGRLKKQMSDFICWHSKLVVNELYNRLSMPLEVKSTEHSHLLTKAHLTQLPMLNKVALSGASPFVLVLFKGLEKWRIAPISFFHFGATSWNMSNLPLFDTAQQALESTGYFPLLVVK